MLSDVVSHAGLVRPRVTDGTLRVTFPLRPVNDPGERGSRGSLPCSGPLQWRRLRPIILAVRPTREVPLAKTNYRSNFCLMPVYHHDNEFPALVFVWQENGGAGAYPAYVRTSLADFLGIPLGPQGANAGSA